MEARRLGYVCPVLRGKGGETAVQIYAAAARDDNHYSLLDEREIAANLLDWLQDRRKLGEEASKARGPPGPHVEGGADTRRSGSGSAGSRG